MLYIYNIKTIITWNCGQGLWGGMPPSNCVKLLHLKWSKMASKYQSIVRGLYMKDLSQGFVNQAPNEHMSCQ